MEMKDYEESKMDENNANKQTNQISFHGSTQLSRHQPWPYLLLT